MSLTFRRMSVQYKSTRFLSELAGDEKKKFGKRIIVKKNKSDENNDLTSKLTKTEFKFMRKDIKSSPYDVPPKLTSIRRSKPKYKGYYTKTNQLTAENYIFSRNSEEKADFVYGIRKNKFSKNYHTNSLCANFMLKESKNFEKSLINKTSTKKNDNLINLPSKKYRYLNNSKFKIIKVKNPINNENITIKATNEISKNKETIEQVSDNNYLKIDENRENEINLQMLPSALFKTIFPEENESIVSSEKLDSIKKELLTFGLNVDNQIRLPNVDLELPSLEGKNIEEHFYNIANSQIKPYMKVVNELVKKIPPVPEQWIFQEGWTRYTESGSEKVDYPLEEGLIFDVEVCMSEGPLPTLATAVSKNAWYGWISKSLVENSSLVVKDRFLSNEFLIPLESTSDDYGTKLNNFQKRGKIIIGHNVSYDRARIKEQYWLNSTGTRFIDTMSMHICVSGINSFQRALLKADKEDLEENLRNHSSLNNLGDVHQLYCGEKINKKARDLFVDGTLLQIRENFNDMMKYCANDVKATFNIFQKLLPMFQERFPHPVSFAGMLELGCAYLPVNSNWQRYIEESELTFEDFSHESKAILSNRAAEVCQLMHDEKYKKDLWMWDQDWSTQDIKIKSILTKQQRDEMIKDKAKRAIEKENLKNEEEEIDPLEEKFAYLNDTKYYLPAKMPHMPGYPNWYRKLCDKKNNEDWLPGAQNISTSMKVVPKILNLTWENYPLHYIREHGWGFLVPYNNDLAIETKIPLKELLKQCPLPIESKTEIEIDYTMMTLDKEVQSDLSKTEFWRDKKKKNPENNFYKGSGIWCNIDIDNCCWFFKLPHKDGTSKNVGNPLAKDFLNKFSDNVLAGLDVSASSVLKIARMLSYWRNNRDRILSQLVIWFDEKSLSSALKRDKRKMRYGAILPQVIVSGTLTRRAVEPTWMTASNAHAERIGSELRSMIQAPPGYNIVGADVDSQELWIASIIGDAYHAKIHGATPFGWMTLIGNKADGTDMHSVTAKAIGISRDHAKIINYARIYGAGQRFAERLLKQFNPTMTEAEAGAKSKKMFAMTKGRKIFRLKKEFISKELVDKEYSSGLMFKIAKIYGRTASEMFEKGQWIGGSESAMFNRLEEIAGNLTPVTPFLNSRLSRALEGQEIDDDKYLPTKVNWVVQSGAVDFLHLMLVSMRWLMKDNARFCLSFHDEIRYLVANKYKYNAALAMHITNLLTRSFCSSRLGLKDLPMSVAFFTSVEVDTVLRKEASSDCKTPSNPHGLQAGYEISPGESLDVWKAIEKSSGSIGSWHNKNKINSIDTNLKNKEEANDDQM
ncbi:DNA polymerase subunit gamma-1, mitochondrial isoform X2 [Leptopilina boulardi]|uniref:DNA polymerase subunit gamma-1, mitochondrial isoform X2 n=1 Tax=Leptopilina boulardi TaxID=63433 RepID=UPI0021F676D8|nr:DNA polymerase subunit gamma-1, mitochondrial isoform X2 [Leptopilina boulardi]